MDTPNLQLGHSELIYLLWLMKTLSLPGIGSKPFGDISGEQVLASLATAEQSLQARGIIAIQESGTRINQHALILVGSCALAKASLMVEDQSKDAAPTALTFHFHSKAWVRHTLVESGIHRFDLIESPIPDCSSLIGNATPSNGHKPPAEFTLPKTIVDQVFALLSQDTSAELNSLLENAGLPAESATALVEILRDLQQKIFIGFTYHNRTENMAGDSMVLLRNSTGFWRIENLVDAESVKLTPVSQQAIIEMLNRFVQQAQVP